MTASATEQEQAIAQALEQLTEALNALDQARATLQDIGIREYDLSSYSGYRKHLSLHEVYDHTERMIENLKTWDWEE